MALLLAPLRQVLGVVIARRTVAADRRARRDRGRGSPPTATVAAVTVAEAAAAVVALAVAVDFAHHRGRAFLVLVDAHVR